jgi:hypothetical protein
VEDFFHLLLEQRLVGIDAAADAVFFNQGCHVRGSVETNASLGGHDTLLSKADIGQQDT